jgi:hypothetical protein
MAGAIFVALLLMPPAAFAQARRHGAAGPSAGMRRAAYIEAAQVRAGQAAAKRFDRISGGKGAIDRGTFVHYYEARSAELAGRRFDRIDTDHNGALEPAEIAAWQASHRRIPRSRPANAAAH